MSSPNGTNKDSMAVNRGSVEYPANAEPVPPPPVVTTDKDGVKDAVKNTEGELYNERIGRFISDDIPTSPISPIEGSNKGDGNGAKDGSKERVAASINAFDTAFGEAKK